MKIELGKTVTDQLTGFTGIVISRVEYITGCNQVCVQPRVKDDGSFVEPRYVDEDRLTVSDAPAITLASKTAAGFDAPPPSR